MAPEVSRGGRGGVLRGGVGVMVRLGTKRKLDRDGLFPGKVLVLLNAS